MRTSFLISRKKKNSKKSFEEKKRKILGFLQRNKNLVGSITSIIDVKIQRH